MWGACRLNEQLSTARRLKADMPFSINDKVDACHNRAVVTLIAAEIWAKR